MAEKLSSSILTKEILTRRINLGPDLSKVRKYQIKCALLITSVPLICAAVLTALIFFFAQQNLYFLENGGLLIDPAVRQAYQDRVILELMGEIWQMGILFGITFVVAYLMMGWAVSPFVNAEKTLRAVLRDREKKIEESDWLSESPVFHRVIWGLVQRMKDPTFPYNDLPEAIYRFNFRFFVKFVIGFYLVSLATGSILGRAISTVYTKIVDLAIMSVRMNNKHHYFLAQEELLRAGVWITTALSCFVFLIMGYYVTRYLSNMLFVFIRAVQLHHFPLKLRDSDVYHSLAETISEVAEVAGLKPGNGFSVQGESRSGQNGSRLRGIH